MEGTSYKAIVIPATGGCLGVNLRNGDMSWKDFLSCAAGRYAISLVLPLSHRNKRQFEFRWLLSLRTLTPTLQNKGDFLI